MIAYKGIEIYLSEANEFHTSDYQVNGGMNFVYMAKSSCGICYASEPELALSGMRKLIDSYTDKH